MLPSERRILGFVQANPGVTQREIGIPLDLPQQTLSRHINNLVELGLLQGGDRLSGGRRGQPSLSLSVAPERLYSLGISILADTVSVMLVDLGGNPRGYRTYRPEVMSREAVLRAAADGLEELARAAHITTDRVPGIGIALTGFLSASHTFNTPRSLDEWADIDAAAVFAERFERPAWADNDANASAVGENLVGVGRWARNFAYLAFGAGFGGGVIADGALLTGRHGNAGEFGAMLQPGFHLSPSLELLRRTMAQHGAAYPDISAMLEDFNVQAPGVAEWVAQIADSLSYVCAAILAILDPDAIVLGGRMPRALAELLSPRIVFPDYRRRGVGREPPRIVPADAPGDAAALGAAMLPLQMRVFGEQRKR